MTTPKKQIGLSEEQLKKVHLLILQELNLLDFPPTVQESILAEIGQNIFMAVQIEILRKLTEKDRDSYIKLIEENKPEEATKLLEKHIPNLDEFVANVASQTVTEFKEIEAKM